MCVGDGGRGAVPLALSPLSHTGPSQAHGVWELQVNHAQLSSKKLVFRLQSQEQANTPFKPVCAT